MCFFNTFKNSFELNMSENAICPLCHVGFEEVPKKEIYQSNSCKCTDSKYHSGCIKEMYDNVKKHNENIINCPNCRKPCIKLKSIETFLKTLLPTKHINKTQLCLDCSGWIHNEWNQIKQYWKGLPTNNNLKSMKLIQIWAFVASIAWYILSIIMITYLSEEIVKQKQNETCAEIEHSRLRDECNDNIINKYDTHFLGIFIFTVPVSFTIFIIHYTRMGKMIDFVIMIAMMILEKSMWKFTIKVGFFKVLGAKPTVYALILFTLYLALGIIIDFLIKLMKYIIYSCILPKCVNYSNKIESKYTEKVNNFIYKDGFDYGIQELNNTHTNKEPSKPENIHNSSSTYPNESGILYV